MFADAWVPPVTVDPTDDLDAVARLTAIQRGNAVPEYAVQAVLVDVAGNPRQDVSQYLNRDGGGSITWDSTADVPGSVQLSLGAALTLSWGSAILALAQLVRSTSYNLAAGYPAGTWQRLPVAHFVMTSPGFDDLDAADVRAVTGFDKNYLLQNQPADAFAFDFATTYKAAVQAVFLAAGLITANLAEVCDYPGDWPAKTLPAPKAYPVDGSTSYLAIVNDLLKASGCRGIFTQPSGRWIVAYIPVVASQPLRWRWAASKDPSVSDTDLDAKIILTRQSHYSGDVKDVPNQWVFIQQGLTFQPTGTNGSNGRYVVDNINTPPSGQAYVGRVIRSTQFLPSSGAADLVTQGDAIVAAQLAQAEHVNFTSCPWPAARHYDVFQLTHAALPISPLRRLQAQSWTLPLWGDPMTWACNAPATL